MTVLLVDTDVERMHETARMLQALFPSVDGLSTTDPLLAAKYAFERPVDILIAGLNMKRMNGVQLSAFLREKSPDVRVCLFASRREWAERTAAGGENCFRLPLPITEKSLRDALEMPTAS